MGSRWRYSCSWVYDTAAAAKAGDKRAAARALGLAAELARSPLSPPLPSGIGGRWAEAGMFRKARRVNVRKRNESEEEDEERDEEPPQPQLPPLGADGPATGEAAPPLPRPPLLPLPTGCVPLVSPAGGGGGGGGPGGFAFGGAEAVGRGSPVLTVPPPVLPPPPPPPSQHLPPPPQLLPPPGNNGLVSAASKAKERKNKSKEAAGPPSRGSLKLLSFQDEEEGKQAGPARSAPALSRSRGASCTASPLPPTCLVLAAG